jgi:hypothetical protein
MVVVPDASKNGQISPSVAARGARDDGIRPRRQAVLPERGKFIWRIPV